MIRRLFPYPVSSAAMLLLWLLLNQTFSLAHVLLGAVVGMLGGQVLGMFDQKPVSLRRPAAMIGLACLVVQDIVRSNIAVARIIFGSDLPGVTSGFVNIPLDMRAPPGLAVLATIITATPGTIWVNYDAASGTLTLHVLDLVDESVWLQTIKGRYERRLMEIFE